jgi:hypothetical protein
MEKSQANDEFIYNLLRFRKGTTPFFSPSEEDNEDRKYLTSIAQITEQLESFNEMKGEQSHIPVYVHHDDVIVVEDRHTREVEIVKA